MKKVLLLIIVLLMGSLLSEAQTSTVYQPDSVVFHINTALYPSYYPQYDSVGWIKFSYDENGMLVHSRRERFSEELWELEDNEYEYDLSHNLVQVNTLKDGYDFEYGNRWKRVYTYPNGHQLSAITEYYYDEHSPFEDPWDCRDSASYRYDITGRLSNVLRFRYIETGRQYNIDYEYQGNEVIYTTHLGKPGDNGWQWVFANKNTLLYSNSGLLLSSLVETTSDTLLTTYSYNEQGMICGILKQKLQNDEYINSSRVVFELNEAGYPSVVSFEKWDEQWVEGIAPFYYETTSFNFPEDYIFPEKYLAQQNKQVLVGYTKRLELYYSQTPKPDYDVMEQSASTASATVHPNPTTGQVTVTGKDLRQAEVFNTLGQRVLCVNGEGDALHVDINGLPSGIYFVNVTDAEGRTCMKKVVKEL